MNAMWRAAPAPVGHGGSDGFSENCDSEITDGD